MLNSRQYQMTRLVYIIDIIRRTAKKYIPFLNNIRYLTQLWSIVVNIGLSTRFQQIQTRGGWGAWFRHAKIIFNLIPLCNPSQQNCDSAQIPLSYLQAGVYEAILPWYRGSKGGGACGVNLGVL